MRFQNISWATCLLAPTFLIFFANISSAWASLKATEETNQFSPIASQILTPQKLAINPPSIQEIKQIAKEQNATLVSYSIIGDNLNVKADNVKQETELYIWVIKPTGKVHLRQVDIKFLWQQQNTSLTDLIISSRTAIDVQTTLIKGGIAVNQKIDKNSPIKQLQQLHQILIQPIADLLPNPANNRIIFIPQGSLFLVPFAALQDTSGKYLIEEYAISTAPSIQVLGLLSQQKKRIQGVAKDVLIVGNPTIPNISLKPGKPPLQLFPIPGAEKEALAIGRIFNTQVLIGNQATKSAVLQRMPQARIIHLGTQGLLEDFDGTGIPGALSFAPDSLPSGGINGLLTPGEIQNLKLNAELVVLSGCDTARGRITEDGVVGLSRSFLLAGVPSVVASLWLVPDEPTALLMIEFYQNLQQNPDKSEALRQAMLATMKKYPNPRDWAGFLLIGVS